MRLCVFGAGAVGGHLAAKLAAAGHEVSAVARGPNLEALKARGIALRTIVDNEPRTITGRVRASDRPAELGAQDAVFVTTKATGLAALAAGLETPTLETLAAIIARLAAARRLYA